VNSDEMVVLIMGSFSIMAGVAVIWMAMQSRRQMREMEHRERLAMIERGLVPSPEVDPAAFERALAPRRTPVSPSSSRGISGGIILIGFGLAFAFMLAFAAGVPAVGIGIGGAFALIGIAFLVNGMIAGRTQPYYPMPTSQTTSTTAPSAFDSKEPPSTLGH
jgi:hypothetical protein